MSGENKTQHLRQDVKFENNNTIYTRLTPLTGPRAQNLSLVSQQRRRGETDEKFLMREALGRLRADGIVIESMPKTEQHRAVMKDLKKRPDRRGNWPRGYGYESFCTIDRSKAK